MKTFFLLIFGVMVMSQTISALAGEAPPAVENGDTVESVVRKLGKPQGVISGGRRITYYYEQGTVDFVTGRVEKALLVSREEAHERTVQRELAEKHRLQQAEAERERLTEAGGAELARTLADKAFAARPASERLKYWTQFGKRYPYTDVSVPMAQVAAAVKAEQKDLELLAELVAMDKRTRAIGERFKELDDDYAASLANWKRTEIDEERARLKEELVVIEARVRELGGAK